MGCRLLFGIFSGLGHLVRPGACDKDNMHGQSRGFLFWRAVSCARVTQTPTCSARQSFRLGYEKHMTPPLVDSVSSRWVILGRSGFSFTKPLQFLAHTTFLGLHCSRCL